MQLINNALLDQVTRQAQESPRLRMNYNLHESLDDEVQRLLNALEPGTLLPIHRHKDTDETYILLRGRIRIIFYDESGKQLETIELNPQKGQYGVNIKAGEWHTLEVLESGSVIFEIKKGPYKPFEKEDIIAPASQS
ncbi:MAG: WbuC family cupin fold metalloprotein [Prevotellaceae bacterium]|jgi:cupin fold WbuC family metalloprotein|nr:WbuC family cupin fold metalloprotein [Prevotellaceae bacterium]